MLIVTMAGKSLSLAGVALVRMVKVVNHRREIAQLAQLDERSLKDIGLTRSDVSGALALPWFEDPSRILAERAGAGRAAAIRRGMARAEAPAASAPRVEAPPARLTRLPSGNAVACNA